MPTQPPSNTDVKTIVTDARWLPSRLVPESAMEFVWLPREDQSKISFLADQYLQDRDLTTVRLSLADVRSELPRAARGCHYIFHSAFCCSTLLCRALNVPGASFGLNEPQIMLELARLMRQGKLDQPLLNNVQTLLSRPFGPNEVSIVKPGNEANLLIDPLMRLDERSKGILLYAPLPQFLRSIARKQLWGRCWGRRLFLLLRQDHPLSLGFSDAELFEQTDLQVAAMAWLHHQVHFASILSRFPGRFRTLDSDTFLAGRAQCLTAIGDYFELGVEAGRWAEISESEVFTRHSKEIGRDFSPETEALLAAEMPLIDEEIEMVNSWATTVADRMGLSLDLPDALGAP